MGITQNTVNCHRSQNHTSTKAFIPVLQHIVIDHFRVSYQKSNTALIKQRNLKSFGSIWRSYTMSIPLLRRSILSFLSISRPFSSAFFLPQQYHPRATVRPLFCFTTAACLGASYSYSTTTNQPASRSTTTAIKMMESPSESASFDTGYLNAEDAAALDVQLMSTPGFSLEQLMELAGLSVAEAVYQVLQEQQQQQNEDPQKKILLVCGPGNNGGDGLVAARHLVMFGYDCTIVYPKESKKQHFINLVQQCHDVGIDIRSDMPSFEELEHEYGTIVDAIFGFSFHGQPREPFASILQTIIQAQQHTTITTISVDIPSGWNVNTGDDENQSGFVPHVLISLTAPKLSAKTFKGQHFVGGRFLPPKLASKYNIRMPPYPGVAQVVQISSGAKEGATSPLSWEQQYNDYCVEKESGRKEESNVQEKVDGKDLSWEQQYHQYCVEKEKQLDEQEKVDQHQTPKGNVNNDDKKDESWEQQYQDYLDGKDST